MKEIVEEVIQFESHKQNSEQLSGALQCILAEGHNYGGKKGMKRRIGFKFGSIVG